MSGERLYAPAVTRGELPAGTDPDEVLKTLIAPILLRLVITAEPVASMSLVIEQSRRVVNRAH